MSKVVGAALPLGHGAALAYPDYPFLNWSYINGLGERVKRDNPKDFLAAAQETFQHLCRYRDYPALGAHVFDTIYPLPKEFAQIEQQISAIQDEAGERRHTRWLDLIKKGTFGFQESMRYIDKGAGSWKHQALGTIDDIGDMRNGRGIPFPGKFLTSHWKLFHDALQAHRFYVLHELLPRYGLLSG